MKIMKRYCATRDILKAFIVNGCIRSCFEQFYSQNKKIVIYGASELADIIIKLCKKEALSIYGICDKKVCKDGWKYLDYPIISIETLRNMQDTVVIIAAVGFEDEIKESLCNLGVETLKTVEEVFRE